MKTNILALGLAAAVAAFGGGATAEPLRVALTFGDSLKDHALIAAPMLEERGWRGVFNIVTDKVGAGERYMTWEDIRGLLARGHEVTTHTMTHPNLVKLIADGKGDVARAELVGSVESIRKNTGFTPVYMCSPGIAQNEKTEKTPYARTVPIYSDEIGRVAKEVSGSRGKALEASYTLASDDLYVRARIESERPSPWVLWHKKMSPHPIHAKFATAWTQPYAVG